MHHDFRKFISTDEDRLIVRKWIRGLVILYGLVGLLLVGIIAAQNFQTDVSYSAAVSAPTAMAINSNRDH